MDVKGAQTADGMGLPPLRDVLVDFDGTLMRFGWPHEKDLGDPYPGVVESMNLLRARGYRIVIFTARAWRGWIQQMGSAFYDDQLAQVSRWLDKHGIPYDEISNIKRPAVLCIDDSTSNPKVEPDGPPAYWERMAARLRGGKKP